MVAEVRDDPAGRIRLAADTYAVGRGNRRYRPYRRAVVAFMRWQGARGVLNPLDDGRPGSRWWRAVNEDLLRDTLEAKLLIQRGGGHPSRPSVERWLSFFTAPSAQSWYAAHNASVVAGYLAHSGLAALEAPAERFFMNVVLVRVLYAQALVARRRPRARPAVLPGTTDRAPSVAGPPGPVVDERRSARAVSDRRRRGGGDHRQGEQARPDDGLRGDQRAGRRSVRFLCTRLG